MNGGLPPQSEKDRAVALARRVLSQRQLGIALNVSESELLASQLLRALGLSAQE